MNERCAICNSVSSSEIQTDPYDHIWSRFSPMRIDPLDPTRLICYECNELLDDIDSEWLDEEDDEDDF